MGQAAAAISSIKPAKEIVDTMVSEACAVLKGRGQNLVTMLPDGAELPELEEEMIKVTPTPEKEFTWAEIAQHNKDKDRWVVVNGKVLDLSNFDHPGGKEPIFMWSGKDGSDEFNMMHGESMIYKNLPQCIIGTVKAD